MPPIYGPIPELPKDRSDELFWSGLIRELAGKIDTRQRQNYEAEVLQKLLSGEDVGTALQQQKPAGGVLGGIFDRISPTGRYRGGVDELSPLTQMVISGKLAPMLRDPMQTEYLKARTATEQARGKYYDQGGARTSIRIEPLKYTDLERAGGVADAALKSSQTERWWWRKDWRKAEVLDAWERYKQNTGYDLKNDYEKHQLYGVFRDKVEGRSKEWLSEYEWDPSWFESEVPARNDLEPTEPNATKRGIRAWRAGVVSSESPIGLESIWNELDDESKAEAVELLASGKYTAEELVRFYRTGRR